MASANLTREAGGGLGCTVSRFTKLLASQKEFVLNPCYVSWAREVHVEVISYFGFHVQNHQCTLFVIHHVFFFNVWLVYIICK